MSRKILKKIKLINWHYFENVELEVEDSALFFGDNGSGRDTFVVKRAARERYIRGMERLLPLSRSNFTKSRKSNILLSE